MIGGHQGFPDETARRAVLAAWRSDRPPVFVSSFPSSGGYAYLLEDDSGREIVAKVTSERAAPALRHVIGWAALVDGPLLSPVRAPEVVVDPVHGDLVVSFFPYGAECSFSDAQAWASLGDLLGELHAFGSCGVPGFDPCAGLGQQAHGFAGTRFESLCRLSAIAPDLADGWRTAALTEPSAVCHGDAHARQVVRFPDRLALIDFDRTGDAPALSDLGVAWAWNAAGQLPGDAWVDLLRRFRAAAPERVVRGASCDDLAERTAPFGRVYLLRRALSQAAVSLRSGDTRYVSGMVDAAHQLLG